MVIIQLLLSSFFIWCILIAVLGLLHSKKGSIILREADELLRFAIVICAHDEENVIEHLLDNLQKQAYPAEKFHIFVLADHCHDRTVERAQRHNG
ncbi:MAG: glycosyl transferase, partial [Acidaminococcaceae bacterium]|nr:glycosyl transferase [Acidaminococcaceae bacterium]